MTGRARWRDAVAAADRLTEGDRRTLRLLTHSAPLGGCHRAVVRAGPASVYRCLARLREAGLVGEIHPALRAEEPGLLYLTDLGIATLAVGRRIDAAHLARRARLRGPDLQDRVLALPHLLAAYQLLAAVAGAAVSVPSFSPGSSRGEGGFDFRPARRPVTVDLPAYAALRWGGRTTELILVPIWQPSHCACTGRPSDTCRLAAASVGPRCRRSSSPRPTIGGPPGCGCWTRWRGRAEVRHWTLAS